MSVSFPMYDWPEQTELVDHFWTVLRSSLVELGIDAPADRHRPPDPHVHWTDPNLLVSQTCGLPLVLGVDRHVHVVGAFDHQLPDTEPGDYHSVVIVRDDASVTTIDELVTGVVAVNGAHSQSGHAALRHTVRTRAPHAQLTGVLSGSHRDSVRLVADGTADLAAIDAVSWELARRHEPGAAACRVLLRTDPTPGLPVITSRLDLVTPLRAALAHAVLMLTAEERSGLFIHGLVALDRADYDVIAERSAHADAAGIPPFV